MYDISPNHDERRQKVPHFSTSHEPRGREGTEQKSNIQCHQLSEVIQPSTMAIHHNS